MDGQGGDEIERLTLLVEGDRGVALSATWTPRDAEKLHKTDQAIAHFSHAKFDVKDEGLVIAKHYYSDDKIYSDARLGIKLYAAHGGKTVQHISFGQPGVAALVKKE